MKEPADEGRQGFILIEILVALSVVAVMAALMAGFFGQLRSVGKLKEEIFNRTELGAATSHLQRTLSGARLADLPGNEPEESQAFDGAANSMRFAAITRQGFYSLALRDVRVFVDRAGGVTQLVQTLTPRRPRGEPEETTIVILDDIDDVSFEYTEDGKSYSSKWSKDNALPSAVRLTIFRDVGGKEVSASAIARLF